MTSTNLRTAVAVAAVIAGLAVPALAANRLVNMVPNGLSGETNQDSEPTLAIDPKNLSHMAGSAFTWDNLTGGPMLTATAPIYVSTNRGDTWSLAYIVPSQVGASFPTGDITVNFSATRSGASAHKTSWLYGGILSSAVAGSPKQHPFRKHPILPIPIPSAMLGAAASPTLHTGSPARRT